MKQSYYKTGFTLVEVLVASFLIVIIGLAIVSLQYIFAQSQIFVEQTHINVDQTNANVTMLVRELRTARPGDNGAYPLELAGDHQLIFYSDIDYDGKTEKVRYFQDAYTLKKGVIDPEGYPVVYPPENEKIVILSEYVRNEGEPIFYYYNGDWPNDQENNPLAVPARLSDTKLMRIYLKLNTAEGPERKNFILESYTQIRMLKENL